MVFNKEEGKLEKAPSKIEVVPPKEEVIVKEGCGHVFTCSTID